MNAAEGDMAAVATDVMAIVAKRVRTSRTEIKLDDRLEDLGIESIDAVEMIFDLEEKYDIEIPYNANKVGPEFVTVGDVVRAIQNLIASKA
jgi:acyl carrier protein